MPMITTFIIYVNQKNLTFDWIRTTTRSLPSVIVGVDSELYGLWTAKRGFPGVVSFRCRIIFVRYVGRQNLLHLSFFDHMLNITLLIE